MSHLIQIGNSQGIRIPKALIQQAGLVDAELTLKVVPEGLLITPNHQPRQGWNKAYQTMHEAQDDKLLIKNIGNRFDEEDWEW